MLKLSYIRLVENKCQKVPNKTFFFQKVPNKIFSFPKSTN